ncbi:hypothetical protein [Paraburkholderia sp.]|jgi:hypothetical protein|uniref:hypothetical protein n=1 Tax=Paraburkholderia sp. TaxID=1926495 RepID=UPI002F418E16
MTKPKHDAPDPAKTAEDRLDEALDETFPASDPIAIDPGEDRPDPPHAPEKDKKRH